MAVVLKIGTGNQICVVLGMLVEEAGQFFAERLRSIEAMPSHLPERLRLDREQLELIQEPEAGIPAIYLHRAIVAVP
jgi:hypothetical protein